MLCVSNKFPVFEIKLCMNHLGTHCIIYSVYSITEGLKQKKTELDDGAKI